MPNDVTRTYSKIIIDKFIKKKVSDCSTRRRYLTTIIRPFKLSEENLSPKQTDGQHEHVTLIAVHQIT